MRPADAGLALVDVVQVIAAFPVKGAVRIAGRGFPRVRQMIGEPGRGWIRRQGESRLVKERLRERRVFRRPGLQHPGGD